MSFLRRLTKLTTSVVTVLLVTTTSLNNIKAEDIYTIDVQPQYEAERLEAKQLKQQESIEEKPVEKIQEVAEQQSEQQEELKVEPEAQSQQIKNESEAIKAYEDAVKVQSEKGKVFAEQWAKEQAERDRKDWEKINGMAYPKNDDRDLEAEARKEQEAEAESKRLAEAEAKQKLNQENQAETERLANNQRLENEQKVNQAVEANRQAESQRLAQVEGENQANKATKETENVEVNRQAQEAKTQTDNKVREEAEAQKLEETKKAENAEMQKQATESILRDEQNRIQAVKIEEERIAKEKSEAEAKRQAEKKAENQKLADEQRQREEGQKRQEVENQNLEAQKKEAEAKQREIDKTSWRCGNSVDICVVGTKIERENHRKVAIIAALSAFGDNTVGHAAFGIAELYDDVEYEIMSNNKMGKKTGKVIFGVNKKTFTTVSTPGFGKQFPATIVDDENNDKTMIRKGLESGKAVVEEGKNRYSYRVLKISDETFKQFQVKSKGGYSDKYMTTGCLAYTGLPALTVFGCNCVAASTRLFTRATGEWYGSDSVPLMLAREIDQKNGLR